MWIYVSFLMQILIHNLHNFILCLILMGLMGFPLKYFIFDNSFKKNNDIFKKNISIVQEIIILGIFMALVLTIGNAYEFLGNM